jgi:beta-1,2-mannobiose phosphorylase / 1,2-beta-oligomannan phosphorylase
MHYPVKKNSNAKKERKSFWEKYFPTFSRFFVAKNPKKVSPTKIARPQNSKKIPATALRRPKTALPKIFTMRGMMLKKGKEREEDRKQESYLKLQRHVSNPILKPHERNDWESQATFNPAAVYADGKVHLVYRAIGKNDISVLGYACSQDGKHIHERLADPMFVSQKKSAPNRTGEPAAVSSGGGWNGGCEDPRLTRIGDTLYLLYTAFDGWGSIRIALSSISLDDFLHKRWNWEDPVLISPPGEANKNWVLFPEKIRGKYAILHNVSPTILIDYFDSLDELKEGERVIHLKYAKKRRKNVWDTWVRAAGPPPIKTKYGWLLLYHAIDEKDPDRYKLGAMLLDPDDPTKILYRSKAPILEPDECYENEGFKPGVVYSCGAVVIDGELLVYYGGADCVTCVAATDLEKFLKELVSSGTPKIKNLDKFKRKQYVAGKKIKK